MRLSVVPLVSNPWDVTLSHARQQPWSLLLELSGGGGGASKDSSSRKMGRRFQRPTFHAILQHIFLSLLSGAIVTYAVVLPLFGTITELFARSAILTTCLLTTLATLTSVLDGVSHEIDPSQYLYPSSKSVRKLRNKVAYLALAVSLLSIALVVATAGEAPIIYIGRLYMNLPIISGIMATYMYIIDETIRTALFNPRADIHQIVDELHDDTSENTRLLVILLSLLCDLSLVKEVRRPSHQGGIGGPERDELKLSEKLTNVMANIFLLQLDQQTEAPLEEDAFRISILESLGGPSLLENTSDGIERHQKIINAWIDQPSPRSRKLQEPLSTPLVRGLCVFIGGFGKALEICATTSCGETWKIPPAAFVCMNFAVQATARCLVRSLTPSGRTLCDWKSSHLSIQVPAALQALFQLRNGIVRHSKIVNNGETNSLTLVSNTTGGHLTGECGVIVRACDTAATSILQSLRSLKGLGRIELSLDLDCLEWTNTLLKRHTTTQ